MSSKNLKRTLAAVSAVVMLAGAVMAPLNGANVVSAGEVLGETSFDYKALPWHTCESSPAKQDFKIEDGAFHVTIIKADGADGAKWDLQVRHRNINLKSGHHYKISFRAKASRSGLQLCSKIGNIGGDEEYVELFKDGTMGAGPNMGGQWGAPVELSTEWKEFSGEFDCNKDLKACEWAFHYANATKNTYGGNAKDGDEIWFDDMSLICTTCGDSGECNADESASYGRVNRDFSGLENNFISVNQLGYYPNLKKVAVLGDNDGDILHGATKITLSKDTYEFEVCDASTGKTVYTGTSGKKFYDKDSDDNVCKLDFTDFKTPGEYYIKVGEWRSFNFRIADDIYSDSSHDMLTNAMNYFYQNRSGIDIKEDYITSGDKKTLAHEGGHMTDSASVQKIWKNEYSSKEEATGTYASSKITANGGWYDAGDHGKYVVNGGISVWTLQNMYERAAQTDAGKEKFADGSGVVVIPEKGNGVPDVLDEAAVELDWMTEMVVKADEPTWGKYAGMVYHKLHDHKWTGLATRPYDYEQEWGTVRIVKPPTYAATLNYAACAAQAARLWEPYDAEKAAFYLKEAKNAYAAFEKNYKPADLSTKTHPDLGCECPAEELNETSLYAPLWHAKGGGPYGDNEVRDDAYWAACELYISAKAMGDSDADSYMEKLSEYDRAFEVTTRITGGENQDAGTGGSFTTFNWGCTASAGSLSLALHKDLLTDAQYKTVKDSIVKAADEYIAEEEKQGYGIPYKYDGEGYNDPNNLNPSITIYGYEWGSNSMVINNAIVMAYAYDQTKNVKYMNGVTGAMDYLLGTNPLSFSFITGYGTYHEKNPHHRYWSQELDETLPMAPDGILSGGPNAGLQDPYVRALGFEPGLKDNPSQRCFVDSIEAWSTNEVTINWNSPLAWIVSFLQDEAAKADSGSTPVDPPVDPPVSETTTTTEPVTGEKLLGDVNLDGNVDMSDLSLLALYILKEQTPAAANKANGDVDGDGNLTITDLSRIKQFVSHKIDKI